MSKIQQLNTNVLEIDKTSRHYHDIYNEETTNHPLISVAPICAQWTFNVLCTVLPRTSKTYLAAIHFVHTHCTQDASVTFPETQWFFIHLCAMVLMCTAKRIVVSEHWLMTLLQPFLTYCVIICTDELSGCSICRRYMLIFFPTGTNTHHYQHTPSTFRL